MMRAGKEIEGAVQRLAQMARRRACMSVLAYARPAGDVITGTHQVANLPDSQPLPGHVQERHRPIWHAMGADYSLLAPVGTCYTWPAAPHLAASTAACPPGRLGSRDRFVRHIKTSSG